jgi:hypothetical protein
MKENEFRLWNFSESTDRSKRDFHHYPHDTTARPRQLLRYDSNDMGNHHGFNSSDALDNDHTLYLEIGRLSKATKKIELAPLEHDSELLNCMVTLSSDNLCACLDEYLCFLKFYNHERKVVEFKGPIFLTADRDLASKFKFEFKF